MRYLLLTIVTLFALVSGSCTAAKQENFVGAANMGDVVRAQVKGLSFSLQYEGKLSGETLSGALKAEPGFSDYVYSVPELSNTLVVVVPGELFLYNSGIGKDTRFGFGVLSNEQNYNSSEIAGMYNYVAQYNGLNGEWGTFEVKADGTWKSWTFADGSDPDNNAVLEGKWVDGGKGVIQASLSKDEAGFKAGLYARIAIGQGSTGNLLVIDLVQLNGMALGVKQASVQSGRVDGEYAVLSPTESEILKVQVNGGEFTLGVLKGSLQYDQPHKGFVSSPEGAIIGIVSPKGTFFGVQRNEQHSYLFAGIKK